MTDKIDDRQMIAALERAIERILEMRDELNQLDAAMGDGDTGITAAKAATGLKDYMAANPPPISDMGTYLFNAGRAINNAASSTLGTLTATAFMRAGKEAKGLAALDLITLAKMITSANVGVQERGKAKPGDKTLVDALHPAAEAFAHAVEAGQDGPSAGAALLAAARQGREDARPLRSKMGRGAWVGERTEHQLDPGTVLFVSAIEAVLQESQADSTD